MTEQNTRIVEINGIKLEVDLTTARRIDQFKIGDNVKVLQKNYADSYSVHPGVIVEFVNFKELPTIIIALLKDSYSGIHLDFINFNEKTEDVEITLCSEHELKLEKGRMVDKFNSEIDSKLEQVNELQNKRDYFLKHFRKYFVNLDS